MIARKCIEQKENVKTSSWGLESDSVLWTKSKSGDNQWADCLAKTAGRDNRPISRLPIPFDKNRSRKAMEKVIKSTEKETWRLGLTKLGLTVNRLLGNFETLENLREFICQDSFKLLQGHNHLGRHTALRGHSPCGSCLFCGQTHGDACHTIFECQRFNTLREKVLLGSFGFMAKKNPSDLCSFLRTVNRICEKNHREVFPR